MTFFQIIFFIILDIIVHELVVRWEIRSNLDLFKDIEVPYRWRKKNEKKGS